MSSTATGTIKEIVRPLYLRWLYFQVFPARRPEQFQTPWQYPAAKLEPAAQEPDILILPMTDWHTRIQRTQHLARAFARRGQRCFYLNPHLGREFPRPYLFSSTPQVRELEPGIFEIHVHLPLEPVFHERLISSAETDRIVEALLQTLDRAGSRQLVQFISFPTWSDVARRIRSQRAAPIVYDCHDTLSGFRNVAAPIVEEEIALFEDSDRIIFSSERLFFDHTLQHPEWKDKSLLVRNAVDEALIETAATTEPGGRVVGYIGALDFWFDIDAVEDAAQRHPELEFLLVGRVEDKRVLRLQEMPNVTFTGEVPYTGLPQFLARFRIALIPFLRNDLTLGTNPIKLYEYFSYGLPVVAIRLPELEPFEKLLYLYEDSGSFTHQLESALAEADTLLRAERQQVAQAETWSKRAEDLQQVFRSLLR